MASNRKVCPVCKMEVAPAAERCPRDGTVVGKAAAAPSGHMSQPMGMRADGTLSRGGDFTSSNITGTPGQRRPCPTCGLMVELTAPTCPQDGTALNPVTTDPELRRKYQYLETIGAGGMGVIYKARHLILNRPVAIKMMHAQLDSPETIQRFQIEGKAVSLLSHPYIVAIKDFGTTSEHQPFMVMDYVDGPTLSQVFRNDHKMSPERFFAIFDQVCDALSHAHKRSVLHRDIKPSNIMIIRDHGGTEEIRILDFGVAKLLDDTTLAGQHLTKTGAAIGSPKYMSPEQARGDKVDQRSDIYSVGCVMYEALTGSPPFVGDTALDTMLMHMDNKPPGMKNASAALKAKPALEKLVLRLLEKEPANRYQTMDEVRADLKNIQAGKSAAKRSTPAPGLKESHGEADPGGKRTLIMELVVIILIGALAVGGYLFVTKRAHSLAVDSSTSSTPAISATSARSVAAAAFQSQIQERLNKEEINLEPLIKMREGNGYRVTNKELSSLQNAKLAHSIRLTGSTITDGIFAYLKDLTQLTQLDLEGTSVADLPGIENLKNLNYLALGSTCVSPAAIKRIGTLKKLVELDLNGAKTKIADSDFEHLSALDHLQLLDITGANVKNLPGLEKLTDLTNLNLSKTLITSSCMKKLPSLSKLSVLGLKGTTIADEDLPNLYGLKNLTELNLQDGRENLTGAGLDALQEKLPHCKIKGNELLWVARLMRQNNDRPHALETYEEEIRLLKKQPKINRAGLAKVQAEYALYAAAKDNKIRETKKDAQSLE